MDFLKKYLNWAAGILILAALAAGMVWPYRKSLVLVFAAAGILALVAYVLLHFDEFKRGFRRRSFIYSGNMILVVILVLAILVLVNYFLARHSVMVDLTAGKIHSLSGVVADADLFVALVLTVRIRQQRRDLDAVGHDRHFGYLTA